MEELTNYLEKWANASVMNQPNDVEICKSYAIDNKEGHIIIILTMFNDYKSYKSYHVFELNAPLNYIISRTEEFEKELSQIYNEHFNPNNNERNN